MRNPFGNLFPRKIVGIDIGTTAIKIVEISSWGKTKKLKNYGQVKSALLAQNSPPGKKTEGNAMPNGLVSLAIKEILDEAKIKTKAAIFSIPDFSTFSTSFEIPPMTQKEIEGAITYNASRYITLPISEVTLDWRIISDSSISGSPLKVFVVAVPNKVVEEYKKISEDAGLDLYALEPEVFSITKALIKDNKKIICLIDIGASSSTLNIIDKGLLKRSYSFSFNSSQILKAIYSSLGIKESEAEEIMVKEGFALNNQRIEQALRPLIDSLLSEIKNISDEFFQSEQKQVEEIYLTGGMANMPGLKDYFAKNIQKQIYIPNCFLEFSYPPFLKETLLEMSPSFSVAVGAALNGLKI